MHRVDLGGVGEGFAPVHTGGLVEEALGGGDGGWGALSRYRDGKIASALESSSLIDKLVDESDFQRLLTADTLRIEQQSASDVAGHSPAEEGQHQGGDIADGDLGVSEERARLGHHQIAGRGQPAAASDGGAVDGSKGELRMIEKNFEELAQRLRVLPETFVVASGGHLLQRLKIGAGREMAARSGEDDCSDFGLLGSRTERLGERGDELG